MLSKDDTSMYSKAQLAAAKASDLILWDSRVVHGGRVGAAAKDDDPLTLTRLSVCVAMTPRERADDRVLAARVDGFNAGISFNHCPHEAGTSSGTLKAALPHGVPRAVLTENQQQLL